jgi:hypothetical protein
MSEIKQGIYFNMPADEYRAAEGLSFSGMKALAVSPLKYWHDYINPEKTKEQSSAMIYGAAYHKMTLEPERFYDDYCVLPEDAPRKPSSAQINAKKPSEQTLLDIAWWDKWREQNAGKHILKAEDIAELEAAREMMKHYPEIASSLQGGYSEVSFFLDYQGVRLKGRLDYITPTETIDLKTFSNPQSKNINKCVRNAIVYGAYNLQWFVYSNLRESLRKLVASGQAGVFGDVNKDFLAQFLANEKPVYSCVMQENQKPYEMRKITLEKAIVEGATPNMYWQEAKNSFENAVEVYRENKAIYGDKPWIGDFTVQTLLDEEVPNIIYQNY